MTAGTRAQEDRLVEDWRKRLEGWGLAGGEAGRARATAYVDFQLTWTLAEAKRLHDELAWYWAEFNCDLRDESKDDIRIVIELKRDAVGEIVLNHLYKHTELQTTFGAIMLAIDGGRPKILNLKDFFRCYVDHRFDVITRRTRFELKKA